MALNTVPNILDPDGFYDALLAAHRGLDADQSAALNARLVLLLANHVGDRATLQAALDAARSAGARPDG
ncbi:MAG: DUF2783 domain-containing protein [Shimia sp.]